MEKQKYTLTFENSSAADANRWASELKEYILDATDEVVVEQQRDNPKSQDIGTTLALMLGASAVTEVAKALGQWLNLHREASITIKAPRGEIVATNLTFKDIQKLLEIMLEQKE